MICQQILLRKSYQLSKSSTAQHSCGAALKKLQEEKNHVKYNDRNHYPPSECQKIYQ